MMAMQTLVDPWEAAETVQEATFSNVIWGQVDANSWWCVLEKGIGKLPFDPQVHRQDQARLAIDLTVRPLADMGLAFDLTRSMIGTSAEWTTVTRPSMQAVGLLPKQLHGAWVKVQTVPLVDKNGQVETFTDRNGTVREKTAIQFLAVFRDEDACRADYLGMDTTTAPVSPAAPGAATPANGNTDNVNKERLAAESFLEVFVSSACRGQTNLNVIRETIAANIMNNAMISKYFTVDSPETSALIVKYMALGGAK